MNVLFLLSLLAAAHVQSSVGCPTNDNWPCSHVKRNTEVNLTSEDFQRLTYGALTSGLSKFTVKADFPTPYELLLIGQDAVPLATNKKGQVLMAAGRFGRGKIVVLGHERYLYDDTFKGLLVNAVAWLKPNVAATVGLNPKMSALSSLLQGAGHSVASSETWQPSMGVFCMDASVDTQAKELVNFIESGGGVLIAGDASAWTGKDVITKATGNKIASVAGIYFTNQAATVGTSINMHEIPPQHRVYVSDLGDFNEDIASILSGVDTLEFSWSSRPFIHGRLAFPIVYGLPTGVAVAGAYYGNGKVVLLTHPDQEKNAVFMTNAVKWLLRHQQGVVAINPSISNLDTLQSTFTSASLKTVVTGLQGATNAAVYITEDKSENEADLIHAFVAKGGGLLVAAEAYYWAKNNPKLNAIESFPTNKVINKFGISLTTAWINGPWKRTEEQNKRTTNPYDFRRIVDNLMSTGAIVAGVEYHTDFINDAKLLLNLKRSDTRQLNLLYFALAKGLSTTSLKPPTEANPVTSPNERIFWQLHSYAPASVNIVSINGTAKAGAPWRSTGLYAQPGKAIVFQVPKAAVGSTLEVQFGCQSDDLVAAGWDTFRREPILVKRFPIENETMTLFSKYGGLLYVIVKSPSALGGLEFVVENAEEAPYFKDGITDPASWEKTIRFNSPPWAEIETKDIILTVRSEYVRELRSADIVKTVDMWNRGMEAAAKLAARPYLYPERIITDTQISAGALHAGYPIMGKGHWRGEYLANTTKMVEERYSWGIFHELGHNLQQSVWDYPYSREVTCNLWSVYVSEEAYGVNRDVAWVNYWDYAYRLNHTRDYIQNSTLDAASYVGDYHTYMFNMYLMLQEAFGWQPFINVFAKYQSMLNLSLDTSGVANLWVKMFSQEVNKNLVPYFKRLKWPVSAEVEKELSSLPEWTTNPLNAIL